jgi:hypothetical protein
MSQGSLSHPQFGKFVKRAVVTAALTGAAFGGTSAAAMHGGNTSVEHAATSTSAPANTKMLPGKSMAATPVSTTAPSAPAQPSAAPAAGGSAVGFTVLPPPVTVGGAGTQTQVVQHGGSSTSSTS